MTSPAATRSTPIIAAAVRLTVLLAACLLAACGANANPTTPQAFEDAFRDALADREPAQLFPLLDAAARRRITEQLERLRGLDRPAHQQIIEQLGGVNAQSLHDISPAEYFGLWWRRHTDLKAPTITFQWQTDAPAGEMTVIVDARRQTFAIRKEADRWVWVLPDRDINLDQPADPPAAPVDADATDQPAQPPADETPAPVTD